MWNRRHPAENPQEAVLGAKDTVQQAGCNPWTCAEMHVKLMSSTPARAMQGGSIRHHHEHLVVNLHRV